MKSLAILAVIVIPISSCTTQDSSYTDAKGRLVKVETSQPAPGVVTLIGTAIGDALSAALQGLAGQSQP